jgi:hypothetical protein
MKSSNYFKDLIAAASLLDEQAKPYLLNRPEWSLNDIAAQNYDLGMAWFKREGEDFDKVPEVVANIADGHVPFASMPKNGSLNFLLGFSMASFEAHAWALYDYLSGVKDTHELPFSCIAKVE